MAQIVKNLPTMRETWVRSLGQEDTLEEGMEPTPVFLPGEFHGHRSLAGYSPWGNKELDTTEHTHMYPSPLPQHSVLHYKNISHSTVLRHFTDSINIC